MAVLEWMVLMLMVALSAPRVTAVQRGTRSFDSYDTDDQVFTCPKECWCAMKQVECWALPSPVPVTWPPAILKSSTSLSLSHYDLQDIKLYDYLQDFSQLRLLKLHNSQLTSIPRIPSLPFLANLDLSNNFITEVVSDGSSFGYPTARLNLSGNSIELLKDDSFLDFPNLKVLDLSRNPLTVISVKTFNNVPFLEYLDLSSTELSEVRAQWFLNTLQLYHLNISNSNLTTIPRIASKSLSVLDLSYNNINNFPIMQNLTSLSELYLNSNNISDINSNATKGAINVKLLEMRNNLIQIVNEATSEFKSLVQLDLSHNNYLKHVKYTSLKGLKYLETLILNDCPKLYDIENQAFLNLHNLRVLDLKSTALKVLPTSIRELTNLTRFHLDNTALLCDCHAYLLPKWLINVANSSWTGVSPLKCADGIDREHHELQTYHEGLGCEQVNLFTNTGEWHHIVWGQSALLECNATGEPPPLIIWQSAQQKLYLYRDNSTYQEGWPWFGEEIGAAVARAVVSDDEVKVFQSGHLLVNKIDHATVGRYKCTAINAVSQTSIEVFVGVDDTAIRSLKLESFLFGIACATLFLLITLVVQFIRYLIERLECECCCCCKDRLSPKAKQIRKLLESVETYKAQQLEKLRENYNGQVVGIKDSCYQQMEKLRESYTQQTRNLKDLRDYSTQGLQTVRDQYLDQINRVSDYSTYQMNRVRENYVFQRHKIRKFSAHQLVKLRETYKYQQKTLNKVLENLPDLYLQNCRTGGCQRTDSLIFDNEIQGLDAYYKLDFLDVQSYEGSDYYTPNSTLTRTSKKNDSKKRHSRNSSTSTVFQEAQSWITRKDSLSTSGMISPTQTKSHTRSSSVTTSPSTSNHHKIKPGHRRSLSACLSKQKSSKTSGETVMEEMTGDDHTGSQLETPMYSCAPSLASSPPQSPLHTPYDSPYHCQTAPPTPSHTQRPPLSMVAAIHTSSKYTPSDIKEKVESLILPQSKLEKRESVEKSGSSSPSGEHSSTDSQENVVVSDEDLQVSSSVSESGDVIRDNALIVTVADNSIRKNSFETPL